MIVLAVPSPYVRGTAELMAPYVKDGQIIDEGTHENLLTSCTLYQEMWKAHMDTKDVA